MCSTKISLIPRISPVNVLYPYASLTCDGEVVWLVKGNGSGYAAAVAQVIHQVLHLGDAFGVTGRGLAHNAYLRKEALSI